MEPTQTTQTVETVDLTPTWSAILRVLLAVYEDSATADGRATALTELQRMADAADRYNAQTAPLVAALQECITDDGAYANTATAKPREGLARRLRAINETARAALAQVQS